MKDQIDKINKRLAEIIAHKGLVEPDYLSRAFDEAKRRGIPLRDALIGMGVCLEDQINWAISEELDIPYVLLTDEMLDVEVADKLNLNLLREISAIPIPDALGGITLVMAEPLDDEAYARAVSDCNCELHRAVGPKMRIDAALDRLRQIQRGAYEGAGAPRARMKDLGGVADVYRMILEAKHRYVDRILLRPIGDGLEAAFHLERGWVIYKAWPKQEALSVMTRCRMLAGLPQHPASDSERVVIKTRLEGQRLKLQFDFVRENAGDTLNISLISVSSCIPFTQIDTLLESHREALQGLFSARRPTGVILVNAPDVRQRYRMCYGILAALVPHKYELLSFEDETYFDCPGVRSVGIQKDLEVEWDAAAMRSNVVALPTTDSLHLCSLFRYAGSTLLLIGVDFVNTSLALQALFEEVAPRAVLADRLRAIWSGRRVDLTCPSCGGKVDPRRGLADAQVCPECDGYGRSRGTDLFEILLPDGRFRDLVTSAELQRMLPEEVDRMIVRPSIEEQMREGIQDGRIFNQTPDLGA